MKLELEPQSGRLGGLLRDRNFRLFWLGETTSMFGSSMAVVGLPLVAVGVLHSPTFVVGILQACAWLPWLVIGLPAGAWVDRLAKRPVMLACDLVSCVLFVSVPLAAWAGVLTITQLAVVALLGGIANVFFSTAFGPYLRTLVPAQDRTEANAKIEGSSSAGQVAGPGLGGLAAQAFGAVSALFVNGITFAVSAFCLTRIRSVEPRPAPRHERTTSLRSEIAEGVKFVIRDPYLRVVTLYAGLANFGDAMMEAVVIVFLVHSVGVGAGTAGGLMAAISLGGIVGTLLAVRIGRTLGTARGALLCTLIASPFTLLMVLTNQGVGMAFFVVGGMVYLMGIGAANVMFMSFSQTYVPADLVGRNSATSSLVIRGSMPLGALAGAAIGQWYGARMALLASAVIITLSVLVLFIGPIRRKRDFPMALATAD